MGKYIDKDAVVAEIERRIADNKKDIERASYSFSAYNLEDYFEGYEDALALFKQQFLDTLEVKEMDLEEKARAYDEALKVAKDIRDGKATYIPNGTTVIEAIFPELKESRDERIRKSIIGFLITISSLKDGKTVSNKDFDTKAILEWVAWLEKQKESPDPLEKVSKEVFKNIPTVNPKVFNFEMPKITGITWGGDRSLNDFYLDEGKNWKIQFDNGKSEKEERLIDKLKDLPMEYPLYSPQYGVIYLAEVDTVDDIITCYKHKLPEGATRAELEQEDTVSFYGDGEAGDEDFNVSKDKQLYLFEELFIKNN